MGTGKIGKKANLAKQPKMWQDHQSVKFDEIEKHFNEKRRTLETLLFIIQDKIDLETYYATNIERISYNISTILDKSTLSQSLITIRSYNAIKSEQSRVLVNSLKTEVHAELQKFLDKMTEDTKNLQTTGKKLDKNFKTVVDKFEAVKNQYAKAMKELDDVQLVNQHIQSQPELAVDKKVKIAERSFTLIKEANQQEYLLKANVDTFNAESAKLSEEYQSVLSSYKKLEEERLQLVHDCLMKTVVFEISYMRNLQYDIDRIGKKLSEFDMTKDLEDFVAANPPNPSIRKLSFEEYLENIKKGIEEQRVASSPARNTEIKKIVEPSSWSKSIFGILDFKNMAFLESDKAAILNKILSKTFTETSDFTADDLVKYKELSRTSGGKVLCLNFLHNRINDGKNKLSEKEYNKLASLLRIALDTASKEIDHSHVAKLVLILELFFKEGVKPGTSESGRIYLYTAVIGATILKSIAFWEAAFWEGVLEELGKREKKKDNAEDNLKCKQIIAGYLGRQVKRMLYFEVEKKDIRFFFKSLKTFFYLDDSLFPELEKNIESCVYPNPDRIFLEHEAEIQLTKQIQSMSPSMPLPETDGKRKKIFEETKSEVVVKPPPDLLETQAKQEEQPPAKAEEPSESEAKAREPLTEIPPTSTVQAENVEPPKLPEVAQAEQKEEAREPPPPEETPPVNQNT